MQFLPKNSVYGVVVKITVLSSQNKCFAEKKSDSSCHKLKSRVLFYGHTLWHDQSTLSPEKYLFFEYKIPTLLHFASLKPYNLLEKLSFAR